MAQGGLQAAVKLYEGLKQEWGKKPADLDKCGQILAQLKIALLGLSFLPSDASKPSKQELLLAREVLEVGAQWSIRRKDIPSFERYMAQLKPYYLDYGRELPQSAYAYQMLGLNLLRLLAQNRIAEFHSEIELVDPKELLSNIYLKHPIALEQYLMEGSYNKVFLARGNVPADSYAFLWTFLWARSGVRLQTAARRRMRASLLTRQRPFFTLTRRRNCLRLPPSADGVLSTGRMSLSRPRSPPPHFTRANSSAAASTTPASWSRLCDHV
eukprot:Opistho-2@89760